MLLSKYVSKFSHHENNVVKVPVLLKQTTIADLEVQEKGKKEKNWMDEERELQLHPHLLS